MENIKSPSDQLFDNEENSDDYVLCWRKRVYGDEAKSVKRFINNLLTKIELEKEYDIGDICYKLKEQFNYKLLIVYGATSLNYNLIHVNIRNDGMLRFLDEDELKEFYDIFKKEILYYDLQNELGNNNNKTRRIKI